MNRQFRFLLIVIAAVWVSGCSNALRWAPDYHVVKSGETLYSIATAYNLDYRQLASWNKLGDGTFIRQGQRLRLQPPSGYRGTGKDAVVKHNPPPATPPPQWHWPANGQIIAGFGATPKTASGIRIGGQAGQEIFASAGGEVVYAGGGLPSYGQLLIIKHDEHWLTAYGFNERLMVREGDRVLARQPIARMGTEPSGQALLHFEIRSNGQPVNPLGQLPAR